MIDTFNDFVNDKERGEPYYFGLGFIKCRLNETFSANFYHPDLMKDITSTEEEWHDHKYGFASKIVKGELINDIANLCNVGSETATHEMWMAECKPGEEMKILSEATPEISLSTIMCAGSQYIISHDTFHRVKAPIGAITLLWRGEKKKEYARVLKPKIQGSPTCPYSAKKSSEELYAKIEDLYARL